MQHVKRVDTYFSVFPGSVFLLSYAPLYFRKKSLLSQLLKDRLTDFLEIKYVNTYWYEDVH